MSARILVVDDQELWRDLLRNTLQSGVPVKEAIRQAGVSAATYFRWRVFHPERVPSRGAVLIAANVAPTEEIRDIASAVGVWQLLALICLGLAIVFEFRSESYRTERPAIVVGGGAVALRGPIAVAAFLFTSVSAATRTVP